MEPEKVDPNDTVRHPVLALRAEGPLGFVRSVLQLVGGAVLTCVALFGNRPLWWLIASVPLTLFALVEVIGSLRYARLVRDGRADRLPSRLE